MTQCKCCGREYDDKSWAGLDPVGRDVVWHFGPIKFEAKKCECCGNCLTRKVEK